MIAMNDREGLRKEINDADDTGLVAGEELITQAETVLPLVRLDLPQERLHAALPKAHDAHARIDELATHLASGSPDRQTIEGYVTALRSLPELEAIIANWWDGPKVQRFIATLGQIGL